MMHSTGKRGGNGTATTRKQSNEETITNRLVRIRHYSRVAGRAAVQSSFATRRARNPLGDSMSEHRLTFTPSGGIGIRQFKIEEPVISGYRTIGFWRFIWHSIRHAAHEITTADDGYKTVLYVCHKCKVVTPAE